MNLPDITNYHNDYFKSCEMRYVHVRAKYIISKDKHTIINANDFYNLSLMDIHTYIFCEVKFRV